uniref:Large ribosomal subunit protein bL19c n=1 Tax=Xylochloris irregularis TaxID=480381 RepID=A0A097KMC7_9CHLO|nr:ribosomal protein L19 [Xylochloris irregularis]AIT94332.1 ribosomal protein L19 [Xylochloris irregularis]
MKPNLLIQQIEQKMLKPTTSLPEIRVGDTVQLDVLIREVVKKDVKAGNKQTEKVEIKERVQPYEGVVIAHRNGGIKKSITVRKIFQGIGVERVFFVHSRCVKAIRIKSKAKVRRAKLYYLRGTVGKKAKL